MEKSDGAMVITEAMLRIYARFAGEADAFARLGTPAEHRVISDRDWYAVGELIQRIAIVKSGAASAEFIAETEREVGQYAASSEAAQELWRLA